MTVRSHVPWHWQAAGGALLLGLVVAVVWTLARQGETAQLQRQLAVLQQQVQSGEEELSRYRLVAGTEQSAAQMERVTQEQLVSRIKALEVENAGLKEDIAFFERLVPADGDESTLRVERLRVSPDAESGRYRYRLLVGFVASKQMRLFRGNLQLVVTVSQAGRDQQFVLPEGKQGASEYLVEVQHFLRKEGVFAIPTGSRLKGVEVRLYQGGTLKAKRLAQL